MYTSRLRNSQPRMESPKHRPKSSEQLVTRDAPTAITFQERVLTESYDEPTGLAKVSSNTQYESLGCGDQDLRGES